MKTSRDNIEDVAAAWVFRRQEGLTAEEQAEFERWCAADPAHRAILTRQERAWSVLDKPRDGGKAGVVIALLTQRALRRRRRRIGVAAAAAVLLIAGFTYHGIRQPSADAFASQARPQVIRPDTQTLPDGTIVELKSGAGITADFSGPLRRVTLERGEAHFQVAAQARPFVVTAGKVEFRAVGTAFSVQLAASRVELLVTEGTVAVEKSEQGAPGGNPAAAVSLAEPRTLATVTAGNQVSVALEGNAIDPIVASAVPPDALSQRLSWRAPRLEFTDTPLAEAIALMNEHGQVELVITEAELGKMRVSGLFRADRTDAFIRLLEANFGVVAEPRGAAYHLRRKR